MKPGGIANNFSPRSVFDAPGFLFLERLEPPYLAKRGWGRFKMLAGYDLRLSSHRAFLIPLGPPLQKGEDIKWYRAK